MRYGIAVDPGLRGCGLAFFDLDTKKLILAEYVRNTERHGFDFVAARAMTLQIRISVVRFGMEQPERFWGECPVSYQAGAQKGDQNDLIHLAGFVYMIAGAFENSALCQYTPREWKGTIEKEQMADRIIGRLDAAENAAVRQAGVLTHNIWDAVGIGLHALGRLERKRVFGGINA